MAPLRTAATTAALRLATQRFVSAGGKSTVVQSVHSKTLPSANPSVFSSPAFAKDFGKARDTSDSNEDYHRSRFGKQNRRFELDYALGLRPFLVGTFCPFTESIDDRGYRLKKNLPKNFLDPLHQLGDRSAGGGGSTGPEKLLGGSRWKSAPSQEQWPTPSRANEI
jgi:hypothetical protein